MKNCDLLIRNARIYNGLGDGPDNGPSPGPANISNGAVADLAVDGDRIVDLGPGLDYHAAHEFDARGLALAPGFIDVHTHDDTAVLRTPQMLPKISQGVTTVIVGNCGISASPVTLHADPPDPMNLLGGRDDFRYPTFREYISAIAEARPAVNVAALIGHTALRSNHMNRLDRAATEAEVGAMRAHLDDALAGGALGLSTGLAYLSAIHATTEEVIALAQPLAAHHAVYTTHLRSETETILDALREAFTIGDQSQVPVIVSHLKCAGIANWGRSPEVLSALEAVRETQAVGCDCYPYAAGSSTLDLRQVDERVAITITWSTPHPEVSGQPLARIAESWGVTQLEAARRLQPAGAIYHSISEEDMRRILAHPATMIGSDGLPLDPRPHPRLWGTFPRVLGRYSREEKLLPLAAAIHKMTGMPAARFGLEGRGVLTPGAFADLVLFDPESVTDTATYSDPIQPAKGISHVWVNGVLTYTAQESTGERAGRFLPRGRTRWIQ
ncbi:N-acyl-D-amino-acid deacylase family protein [Silvibacterium sp.]|uniref:N-acyl-D-amino-acid deacylase family protein n=1 Tax=Silvibacterium sp. TaxID=1964179 RepID=UPI0039E4AD61